MIKQIIDRCHVGQSNLSVARYLLSRFNRGAWRKLARCERRKILREAFRIHGMNQRQYAEVISGQYAH